MSVKGVWFGEYHSYQDWGMWLSKRPDLGSPEPRLNLVDVRGMDGNLDLTEVNSGDVKFSNRTLVFTFAKMVPAWQQEEFKSTVRNALHGRVIDEIYLDEDIAWAYTGRAYVEFENLESWKLQIVVTVDAFPYAMARSETIAWLYDTSATVENVNIPRGVSSSEWTPDGAKTHILFGTSEFPDGIDYANADRIVLSWRLPYVHVGPYVVTIYDSLGSSADFTIPNANSAEYSISYVDISSRQIDLTKVYKITVSGITECECYTAFSVYHFVVQNARKNVSPLIVIRDSHYSSAIITVNGADYDVSDDSFTDGLYLRGGVNDVYIDPSQFPLGYPQTFYMQFREGKL